MNVNIKHLLSGLSEEQIQHPSVHRLCEALWKHYEETGYGMTTIRWVKETYPELKNKF